MAITIKRMKNQRGVLLSTLKVGDTFLCNNQVGVIASHDGQDFPMQLPSCEPFSYKDPRKLWDSSQVAAMIGPDTVVLPIEVEMNYKVVG